MIRVAITGLGAVAGTGIGVEPFIRGLLAGESVTRRLEALRPRGLDIGPMAVVPGSLGPGADGAGVLAGVDRATPMALQAATEAMDSAGWPVTAPERLGVCVGTTLGGKGAWLGAVRGGADAQRAVGDWTYGAPARAVAELVRAGRVRVVSAACASGNAAIGAGLGLIRDGLCEVVLCGGVDALQDFVIAGFCALRAHAREPCRPFDVRRSGLNLGEGAGFVVLEALQHASARGRRALAFVDGWGMTCDANHMTGPDRRGLGAARSMQQALRDAGAAPEAVDFVSLHGTATRFNDLMEAGGLHAALGPRAGTVPVNSIKGCIGHTLGAAGVLEAIMIVRAMADRLVPPTAGCGERDPEIDLLVIAGEPLSLRPSVVLSTSSGFGGLNAALVLRGA